MKTLTIELPDSVDPTQARWEIARALYENGSLTLVQAATMVELTPTYFTIRVKKPFDASANQLKHELLADAKPFSRQTFNQLVDQLNIQEPWEDLVSQIGK